MKIFGKDFVADQDPAIKDRWWSEVSPGVFVVLDRLQHDAHRPCWWTYVVVRLSGNDIWINGGQGMSKKAALRSLSGVFENHVSDVAKVRSQLASWLGGIK